MDQIVLEDETAVRIIKVGIGDIACQRRIVVPQSGAQQHRPRAVDRQKQMREVTRVAIENSLGPAMRGGGVAVTIKNREYVAELEREGPPLLKRNVGGNEKRRRRDAE